MNRTEAHVLHPGTRGQAELTVGPVHLARELEQNAADGFPAVFATMQMVGLMELAASRVLHPILQAGQMSVGVTVEIRHSAPTPEGAKVSAEAIFTGMQGKLYVFELVARDAGGENGRGTHRRAIVDAARLAEAAAARTGGVA